MSTKNFQMFKLDLEKAEEPEIKLPASTGSWKKQENSRKASTSALFFSLSLFFFFFFLLYWLCQSLWLYGSQQTVENSSRHGNTTLSASWETCMQVKKQQLELDMEQWTGSKLGKEYIKAVYCHPANLTSSRVHHEKRWAGRSTSLNKNCQEI